MGLLSSLMLPPPPIPKEPLVRCSCLIFSPSLRQSIIWCLLWKLDHEGAFIGEYVTACVSRDGSTTKFCAFC